MSYKNSNKHLPHPDVGLEYGIRQEELSYLSRNAHECFKPSGDYVGYIAFRFNNSLPVSDYLKKLIQKYSSLPGNEFIVRLKDSTLYVNRPSFINVPIDILEQNNKERK